MSKNASFIIVCAACLACAPVMQATTEIQATPDGPMVTKATSAIDGEVVKSLRREWETEYVEATGSAPYVEKYPGQVERNRALAAAGAKVLAYQGLVERIASIQVTSTTTMADFMATVSAQARVRGMVQGAEVVSEGWSKAGDQYEIHVRMPKIVLLRVIQESR